MNIEQERAEFEAWYQLHHVRRDMYERDASGEYADKQVQSAFNVWQARAALQSQHETQLQVWRSTDSCGEFWSWDEADQHDYDRAKPEDRRVIQIIKEG